MKVSKFLRTNNGLYTKNVLEVEKFSKISKEWWDPLGNFKPLHELNPHRMKFIRKTLSDHYKFEYEKPKPFKNLKVLDIGCGGGLVSESFANLGASVIGSDASYESIQVAKTHSSKNNLSIEYLNETAEDLTKNYSNHFDVISSLEIIEHVDNVDLFLTSLIKMLKPDGVLFISSLNKTFRSYLMGVLAAEYVLNWVPKGTHDWNKFVDPVDLTLILEEKGIEVNQAIGIYYDILKRDFDFTTDLGVNYILSATKKK
eukprot:gene10269-2688_t